MAKTKKIVITILLILLAWLFWGQEPSIKSRGQIIIPGAIANQKYPVSITLSEKKITVACTERIFRLLNSFGTPYYRTLNIDTNRIAKISIDEKDRLAIVPDNTLYRKYRHLFHNICKINNVIAMAFYLTETPTLLFILDDVSRIKEKSKNLFAAINKKNNQEPKRVFQKDQGRKLYHE